MGVARAMGVRVTPWTVIIDRSGTVVAGGYARSICRVRHSATTLKRSRQNRRDEAAAAAADVSI